MMKIVVWFFLATFSHGVTQAGPFVSVEQCEQARVVWQKTGWSTYASPCYQGVWN